jgi:uncharacterized protein YggL (DUF469 family)
LAAVTLELQLRRSIRAAFRLAFESTGDLSYGLSASAIAEVVAPLIDRQVSSRLMTSLSRVLEEEGLVAKARSRRGRRNKARNAPRKTWLGVRPRMPLSVLAPSP